MFTQKDIDQLHRKGINEQMVQKQIDHFIAGFPFIRLAKPAIIGDGILQFDLHDVNHYQSLFEHRLPSLEIVKFVPASGAASRMFKHLFEFIEKYRIPDSAEQLLLNDHGVNSVHWFLDHLRQIAFFDDMTAIASKSGDDMNYLIKNREYKKVLEYILSPEGLNYANLPKAVLKFHGYPEGSRTALEEHLVEAALYARNGNGTAHLHFTISPEHRLIFTEVLEQTKHLYESRFDLQYKIDLSIQKPSTDTIALDANNIPVRNSDGTLLFRPGGHGALLENLNEIDADMIFIKNIDNIVPDRLKPTTVDYKKLLGGYLLSLTDKISAILVTLQAGEAGNEEIEEIIRFARAVLFIDVPDEIHSLPWSSRIEILIDLLNRPVRVCGMVKNEGEPGGGPFWVTDNDQRLSLQIVESSQIDMSDKSQSAIARQLTHFNPVDLVCSTKSFNGTRFDLEKFVDENTGFISLKSIAGKTLKAQELPGLWNGSMAKWITIFIEVPILTFNPVKTVNDLLRDEHISH